MPESAFCPLCQSLDWPDLVRHVLREHTVELIVSAAILAFLFSALFAVFAVLDAAACAA